MSTYRAAIVGCGDQSVHHAHAYAQAGIPVVAGADISHAALERFGRHVPDARTYTDYGRMLDDMRPDLVTIATHHPLHCEMVVAAAGRGAKGIVCEKPMAMDLAEADRMLDACRSTGSTLVVCHQRCYEAPYRLARELIAHGEIGTVRSVDVNASSCSMLGDGTHAVHMLLWLLGKARVAHLLAQVQTRRVADGLAEEAGTAFLAFDSGPCAHLTWGLVSREPKVPLHPGPQRRYYQSFVIHGDAGRLEVASDGPETEPRYLRVVRGARAEDVAFAEDATPYNKVALHRAALVPVIQDLVRSIETGSPHPLDGRSGRDVMEVIMAIYESSRRRRAVTFPLDVTGNPLLAMDCSDERMRVAEPRGDA